MIKQAGQFHTQLLASGMPEDFSTVIAHQAIPGSVLQDIDRFIEVFEQVTTRPAWVNYVLEAAPEIAAFPRGETCFFSAWDIHIPPKQPHRWQLIEFNDNGSGFLFAGLLNRIYYEHFISGQKPLSNIVPPPTYSELCRQIQAMIAAETEAFFNEKPAGLLLILDDAASLKTGKFRSEHRLMAEVGQQQGWTTAIAPPESLHWNGNQLQLGDHTVAFVINRSTDFLWQSESLTPLIHTYHAGTVYIAPNPFSYATRSDKQLLEFLSRPEWDEKIGITKNERTILSQHIPATYQVNKSNLNQLTEQKNEFVFKPAQGHASLGILDSHEIGRHRLQRLLAKGHLYVAQHIAEKSKLLTGNEQPLWTDLRVWAYKGKRYQLSGRASVTKARIDLHQPGGWLPTFEQTPNNRFA